MIILYTDASTKKGISCIAYKSTLDLSVVETRIISTKSSATAEIMAIIEGINSLPVNRAILVVCDYLRAVNIISKKYKVKNPHTKHGKKEEMLINICKERGNIKSIWIPSKFPDPYHRAVDRAAKDTLNLYLKI